MPKEKKGGWKVSAKPVAPKAAIDFFKQKEVVDEEEYAKLEKHLQRKAFKVAGVAQMSVVQDVLDQLQTALKNGTTLDDFKAQVSDSLAQAWGGENPGRVQTIFRTNMATAYSAGRQAMALKVKKTHPFMMFDGIEDDRQTDECAEADGTILHQDDPWWETHTPPLHYNCRSQFIVLSEEDAESLGGESDEGPDIETSEGFGGKLVSAEDDDFNPKAESYDHELFSAYKEK